jgi:hypothetical protein
MGITNAALNEISGLVGGVGSKTAFGYIALDSDATVFSAAQTALVAEISGSGATRAAATVSQQTTTQTNDTVRFVKAFSITGNVTVNAIGVFNQSSSGTMLNRDVLGASRSFVNGDSYTVTVNVKFAYA